MGEEETITNNTQRIPSGSAFRNNRRGRRTIAIASIPDEEQAAMALTHVSRGESRLSAVG
jgi:hypothetical protein